MKKKLKALEEYFSDKHDVLFAFLFGSQAKKIAGRISDWDIAVYFKPQGHGQIEWEETEKDYPQENKIWDDIIDILKTDNVDLVVLNRAPSNISASVISEGIPLIIRDRKVFLDFMLLTLHQAEDYAHFVDNYYEIYQRSTSLSPKDKEKLKKIVVFLEQEMHSYDYFSVFSFADYQDVHKRRDVERWVENMINSALDIGEIILASEKKKIPDYYKDVFVQLSLLPQFELMDVEKFTGWVKLRNILAHEYLDIKWQRINSFVKDSNLYFRKFLESVKKIFIL